MCHKYEMAKKDVPGFVLCPFLARQIISYHHGIFFLIWTWATYNFHTSVKREPINHKLLFPRNWDYTRESQTKAFVSWACNFLIKYRFKLTHAQAKCSQSFLLSSLVSKLPLPSLLLWWEQDSCIYWFLIFPFINLGGMRNTDHRTRTSSLHFFCRHHDQGLRSTRKTINK